MDQPSQRSFLVRRGRRKDTFVVGAAIGTGAAAAAVARGGADFLVALNAGRFRMMGTASCASNLALRDNNDFVAGFAREEILPRARVPVFFGAAAFDVRRDLGTLVGAIRDWGFSGIVNFPTATRYFGPFRAALEAGGLGIARELEMLELAQRAGLMTMAYVRSQEDGLRFAAIGVDMVCMLLGFTATGGELTHDTDLSAAAGRARSFVSAVRRADPRIVCLVSGGPIVSPENVFEICELSKADGYVGGSTLDRLPLESSIEDRTAEFKAVPSLRRRSEALHERLADYERRFGLVMRAVAMREVQERVTELAQNDRPVLISGEAGTGKSLIAQVIHALSPRRRQRLQAVACAAHATGRIDLELFGCEAGAVSGYERSRIGWFHMLAHATCLLKEIAHLPPVFQEALVEVLESGRFWPLGSRVSLPFEVRLIFTTRCSVLRLVEEERLVAALHLNLKPQEIVLPPLRERMEELPLLVGHMLESIRQHASPRLEGIEHAALRRLQGHDWPGNIRELRSVIEEAALNARGARITVADIEKVQASRHPPDDGEALPDGRQGADEREWIMDALRRHRFRRGEAAAFLGLSRKTLYNKMRRYGLLAGTPSC